MCTIAIILSNVTRSYRLFTFRHRYSHCKSTVDKLYRRLTRAKDAPAIWSWYAFFSDHSIHLFSYIISLYLNHPTSGMTSSVAVKFKWRPRELPYTTIRLYLNQGNLVFYIVTKHLFLTLFTCRVHRGHSAFLNPVSALSLLAIYQTRPITKALCNWQCKNVARVQGHNKVDALK